MNGKSWTAAVAAVAIAACLLFSYVQYGTEEKGELSGEIFVVHTNDTHGHYDESLGFGAVKELKDDLESEGATVFLMDAGDAFQGTVYTTLSHGGSSMEIMNAVGYDLMVPGNHEFDYTLETYLGYTEELGFPTVCANLVWAGSGERVFDEYLVIEKNGCRLGVFGLATPDTPRMVMSGYLDEVEFTDPVEASEDMVDTLTDLDVDFIVAVGHIGVDPSSSVTSDMICADVPGIDVFIDGHSHTVMESGKVKDGSIELLGSDTLIASTGAYFANIGIVHLTAEGGPTAKLVDTYASDAYVDSIVDSILSENEEMLSEVIGRTEIELSGERTASRLGEVGMGDFVTDTMRELTGADIAVCNGGSIRATIEPGDVTKLMLYTVFPFENTIVTKTFTGQQVWDLMEYGVSGLPGASGGYQQVSGMQVVYDSSLEAGSRIVSITMPDGTPIDPDGTYLMASNDFVMAGGDGFEFIAEIPVDDTFGLVIDALFDRFEDIGTVTWIETGRLTDISA